MPAYYERFYQANKKVSIPLAVAISQPQAAIEGILRESILSRRAGRAEIHYRAGAGNSALSVGPDLQITDKYVSGKIAQMAVAGVDCAQPEQMRFGMIIKRND